MFSEPTNELKPEKRLNKVLLWFKALKERRKSPFRERLSGIDLSKG